MIICCRTERFAKHHGHHSQRPLTTYFGIGFSNFRDSRSGDGTIAFDQASAAISGHQEIVSLLADSWKAAQLWVVLKIPFCSQGPGLLNNTAPSWTSMQIVHVFGARIHATRHRPSWPEFAGSKNAHDPCKSYDSSTSSKRDFRSSK